MLILKMRKKELTFLGYIIREEGLNNLTLAWHKVREPGGNIKENIRFVDGTTGTES